MVLERNVVVYGVFIKDALKKYDLICPVLATYISGQRVGEAIRNVYVIHCSSIVWVKNEVNPKVHAVNVGGTANILAQCIKHHVRKLIYISSTGAIPELPHGEKTGKSIDSTRSTV